MVRREWKKKLVAQTFQSFREKQLGLFFPYSYKDVPNNKLLGPVLIHPDPVKKNTWLG